MQERRDPAIARPELHPAAPQRRRGVAAAEQAAAGVARGRERDPQLRRLDHQGGQRRRRGVDDLQPADVQGGRLRLHGGEGEGLRAAHPADRAALDQQRPADALRELLPPPGGDVPRDDAEVPREGGLQVGHAHRGAAGGGEGALRRHEREAVLHDEAGRVRREGHLRVRVEVQHEEQELQEDQVVPGGRESEPGAEGGSARTEEGDLRVQGEGGEAQGRAGRAAGAGEADREGKTGECGS